MEVCWSISIDSDHVGGGVEGISSHQGESCAQHSTLQRTAYIFLFFFPPKLMALPIAAHTLLFPNFMSVLSSELAQLTAALSAHPRWQLPPGRVSASQSQAWGLLCKVGGWILEGTSSIGDKHCSVFSHHFPNQLACIFPCYRCGNCRGKKGTWLIPGHIVS